MTWPAAASAAKPSGTTSQLMLHGPAPVIDAQRYQPLFAAVPVNPEARNHMPGAMPSVAGFVVATLMALPPAVTAVIDAAAAPRSPTTLSLAPTAGAASTTVTRPPSVTVPAPVAVARDTPL